jgi:hypothetical protein
MKSRSIARAAGSLALIVLSTSSTATDCERRNDARDRDDRDRVVVRADDDVCWRVRVDGRTESGCGDATFYRHDGRDDDEVEKVDGNRDVNVTVIVDGKTVYRDRVRSNGERVRVKDRSDDDSKHDKKRSDRQSDRDDA